MNNMIGIKVFLLLFVAAVLSSSLEQNHVGLSSPSSPVQPVNLLARANSSACDGTPEINAEAKKAFSALSDLLTSVQSATDADAAQEISDNVGVARDVATAIAMRPNFEMDADGQQFIYDWIFEWADLVVSFMDKAPSPIPSLQEIIWGSIVIAVYEVTESYFCVKDFGKCLGCDNVHKMNLRIASLRCDLRSQSIRTGWGLWMPILNL